MTDKHMSADGPSSPTMDLETSPATTTPDASDFRCPMDDLQDPNWTEKSLHHTDVTIRSGTMLSDHVNGTGIIVGSTDDIELDHEHRMLERADSPLGTIDKHGRAPHGDHSESLSMRNMDESEAADSGGDLITHPYEAFDYPKRELRPQSRQKRVLQTTWMDNDDTGDYDPEEEERQKRVKRARYKLSRKFRQPEGSSPVERSGEISDEGVSAQSEVDISLVVKLKLTCQKEGLVKLLKQPKASEAEHKGYKLRRKVHEPQPCSTHAEDEDTAEDLTAKPYPRGCRICSDLNQPCSLMDDEKSWPCDHCNEERDDCGLIVHPIRKRACEGCKRRRLACSYTSNRNHSSSCDQCASNHQACVAGPVVEYVRTRLWYIYEGEDEDGNPSYGPPKLRKSTKIPKDCAECVQAGKNCTYNPDPLDGRYRLACASCLSASLPCTVHDGSLIPQQPPPSSDDATPQESPPVAARSPTSERLISIQSRRPIAPLLPPPRRRSSPKDIERTITTSFAHPIIFNYDEKPSTTSNTCHLCTEKDLPIFGFGIRNVKVIDWANKEGYIETQGGHRANGVASTRICTVCTTTRMTILTCERHDMQAIPSAYALPRQTPQQTLNAFCEGKIQNADAYCAVCANVALYECGADTEEDENGCGLKLCEPCAIQLENGHDGSLKAMLKNVKNEPSDERPVGLRADHEFLKEDGALMRYLEWLTLP